MKNVGPVRKDLGVKTFFNMLGPMVNPAFPKNQLVGVFSLELARLYNYLYQKTDKNYMVLHSLDGYDEISLTGALKALSRGKEELLTPEKLGFEALRQEQLFGGDSIEASADIFRKVIKGEGTEAQTNVVAANSGMAIHCAKPDISREDSFALAKETILSGKAWQTFEKFLTLNQ